MAHGRTFLALDASEWAGVGIWLTLVVYGLLARFARHQLREARELRLQQSRPFVVVDVTNREVMMYVSVRNAGATIARDVVVRFDPPIQTDVWQLAASWVTGPLFTTGVPSVAPGKELRFMLGSYFGGDFDKTLRGSVSYLGPSEVQHGPYRDEFNVDIGAFDGAEIVRDPLVQSVEKIARSLSRIEPEPRIFAELRGRSGEELAMGDRPPASASPSGTTFARFSTWRAWLAARPHVAWSRKSEAAD
jgi:hypothetical protein